jgi:DNA-binding SARP family transcriptional activator
MVPPLLMVYCFGGLRIVARGGTALAVNDQHIPVKLLALLAASRAGVVAKDDAFTALWPDQADAGLLERLHAACKNLRHLLQKLAPEVSRDVIRQEGNRIALDLSVVASDVPAFWALCARAEDRRRPLDEALALYDQLAALYRGELLAGCGYPWPDLRGEDGFTPREVCKARLTDLTRTLAERSLAEGRPALAEPLLRRLLADDPTRPELVKRLLDCEAGMGNLSELRRVRQSFERACREEFAADPDDPGEDAIMRELLADVRIHYDAILTRLRRLAGGD